MEKYHFDIDDGELSSDAEGTDLKDLASAKCEAVRMAGQVICDAAASFWDRAEWKMTVRTGDGLVLFQLHILGTEAPAGRSALAA
jgi:hypothetical protein